MRVIVVRHGPAHNLGEGGSTTDESRTLTPTGQELVKRCAFGLQRIQPRLNRIFTSPYKRAVETAQIIQTGFDCEVETVEELGSGTKTKFILRMLAKRREEQVAIIGHQPTMGELIAVASIGEHAPMFLKPSGMACLEFGTRIEPGGAALLWLMQSKHLEMLVPTP